MKHIIVFCYIFTILLGVSALTIQWLAGRGDRTKAYDDMKPFVAMLLLMNCYDLFIYYNDHIITISYSSIWISIGDCLIAVLVYLWLRVEHNLCGGSSPWAVKFAKWYIPCYFAVWVLSAIFLYQYKWIRLIIDVPLMALLIAGSTYFILKGIRQGDPIRYILYSLVITVFMEVNYISYFIGEWDIVRDYSGSIMDMTIFYWLVINLANIILLYKRDFSVSYLKGDHSPMNLADALNAVKLKFDLTDREVEILSQLYAGKTNTKIAEELFISESTVKAHIYNIFRKMDVKNRLGAVAAVQEEKEH